MLFMNTHPELNFGTDLVDALLESYVRLIVLRDPVTEDIQGYRIAQMNRQAARALATSKEEAMGRDLYDVLAMDQDSRRRLQERLTPQRGQETFDFHFEQLDRRFLISPFHVSADEIILFFVEVTYRQKVEDVIRIHEVLLERAQDVILFVDMDGRILNGNEKACEVYGYTKEELKLLGILDIRHPSTHAVFREQMEQADEEGTVFECIHVRSDGTSLPVEVSAKSTDTDRGRIRIHIIRDITERKEQEKKIAWLATYDGLTDILNRRSIIGELEREVNRARLTESKLAVLLFDIDKFKLINDSLGHAAGDFILALVAKRVKSVLRQHDQVGRLGGDEFVVLQTGVRTVEDAISLIGRITDVLSKPVMYEGSEITLSISLGASLFPDHATNTEDLMHYADQAMYHTKRKGGNGYEFHQPALTL